MKGAFEESRGPGGGGGVARVFDGGWGLGGGRRSSSPRTRFSRSIGTSYTWTVVRAYLPNWKKVRLNRVVRALGNHTCLDKGWGEGEMRGTKQRKWKSTGTGDTEGGEWR
jgi:hypothetical protein